MKKELQKKGKNLEVVIKTEDQLMDLAYKTHTGISENVAILAKQNFVWMKRVFGQQGLIILINELNNPKLTKIKTVNEFKEQLVDLVQKAHIDALKKKYIVLISTIEAEYQERLIQSFSDLSNRLTLDLRTLTIEMLRNDEKDDKKTEEVKDNKTKPDKMITILDEETGRYFRIIKSLFDKFEIEMNNNIRKYQKHLP